MTHWAIFTDASGDGRIAIVVLREQESERFNIVTDRVECQGAWEAEYLAVKYVFENLHDITNQTLRKGDDIVVSTDSEYVIKQLRGEYKVKRAELRPYHRRILELLPLYVRNGLSIHFEWIPRERNPAGHILESKESRSGKEVSHIPSIHTKEVKKESEDNLVEQTVVEELDTSKFVEKMLNIPINLTYLQQAIEDVSLDYEVTKPNKTPSLNDILDAYDNLLAAHLSETKKKT